MIAVVADDFTGAAELGGVALRFGLTAEVHTKLDLNTKADLISLDTDTRSASPGKAALRVGRLVQRLRKSPVEWVYKKVDSVLRGRVVPEIEAILKTSGLPRAMLVPANPALGRVVRGGHYFINRKPIHLTDLGKDPEYPARSSHILKILGPASLPLYIRRPEQNIPQEGIIVGEAETEADLSAWARHLDSRTLPAGAAGFFGKILEARVGLLAGKVRSRSQREGYCTALFVCGSVYNLSVSKKFEKLGIPVLRMPPGLLGSKDSSLTLIEEWVDATIASLQSQRRVMVTIGRPLSQEPELPQLLASHMAELVKQVLGRVSLDHLYVEGGSIASTVVRRLGWTRVKVVSELVPGVVSMQVQGKSGPLLTTKPGSYVWSEIALKEATRP